MLAAGELLNGRYRLDRQVGRGAFARVFLAEDLRLGRRVAVKALHPELLHAIPSEGGRDFLALLQEEARLAATLEHPNILPVYDAQEATGGPYVVMAYAPGGSLEDLLYREGPLPPDRAAAYLRQAAAALDFAHARGVVHRDVKPHNMLLRDDGHLLLADFGLAKVLDAADRGSYTGMKGTPAYMAPEQFRGEGGPAADVYALGCVLFELLTGEVPYRGPSHRVMYSHLHEPVPSVAARSQGRVPATLQQVLDRAMAKRPEARFRSAGELAESCAAAAVGGGRPRRDRAPRPGRAWAGAHRRRLAVALLVLLLVAALPAVPRLRGVASRPGSSPTPGATRIPVTTGPDVVEALVAGGDADLAAGRFSAALAQYRAALAVDGSNASANRQLGLALWVWNHEPGDLDVLDRATKLAPGDALAWAYLAFAAVDAHQPERASAAARQAVRLNPQSADAYAALADVYIAYPPNGADQTSGVAQAQEAIARAVALDPNNLWVLWFQSQVLQAQAGIGALASLDLENGNSPDATALNLALAPLDRMLAQRPNWPTLYYAKGAIYTRQQRYADARAQEERALALDPEYPYALTELGWLAYLDDDYGAARASFERALRLTDDVNDYAHRGLAFALGAQGDYATALLHCQRAVQIESRRPWGYDCLGFVYRAGLQRYDDASAAYRTVVALRPYLEDGYIGLARTAADQGDYGTGERLLQGALPTIQKPVYGYYWLGWMLFQQQRYQEAQAYFEQAAQRAPNDPNAHFWLGSNLERLGRWDEARAAYRRALAVDLNFHDARAALDRLQREGH